MSKLLELAGTWLLGAAAFAVLAIALVLVVDGIRVLTTSKHYWDPSEIDAPLGVSPTGMDGSPLVIPVKAPDHPHGRTDACSAVPTTAYASAPVSDRRTATDRRELNQGDQP